MFSLCAGPCSRTSVRRLPSCWSPLSATCGAETASRRRSRLTDRQGTGGRCWPVESAWRPRGKRCASPAPDLLLCAPLRTRCERLRTIRPQVCAARPLLTSALSPARPDPLRLRSLAAQNAPSSNGSTYFGPSNFMSGESELPAAVLVPPVGATDVQRSVGKTQFGL